MYENTFCERQKVTSIEVKTTTQNTTQFQLKSEMLIFFFSVGDARNTSSGKDV